VVIISAHLLQAGGRRQSISVNGGRPLRQGAVVFVGTRAIRCFLFFTINANEEGAVATAPSSFAVKGDLRSAKFQIAFLVEDQL
jgi:hypothetical protein